MDTFDGVDGLLSESASCDICGARAPSTLAAGARTTEVFWSLGPDLLRVTSIAHVHAEPDKLSRETFCVCPECWPRFKDVMREKFGAQPKVFVEETPGPDFSKPG